MKHAYSSGVAFIFEGETEQTFYKRLLFHFNGMHPEYSYTPDIFDENTNDMLSIASSPSHSVLIRTNTVRTITQVAHSANWFNSTCKRKYSGIKWTVFLCYDTDSHHADITKFYEDDWQNLRRKVNGRNVEIVDLAARAMIEDLFLLDPEGICSYLGVPTQPIAREGNGKTSLKKFFRKFGKVYHEGERAENLIWCLHMNRIIEKAEIQLKLIDDRCFPHS